MSECQASPQCTPPTQYSCNNGTCVQDPNGQYVSLAQCQHNCSATVNCAALIPNWHTTVDQKEANAIGGGNGCNWICNKVNSLMSQQPFPNTAQGIRKQCKLDYINDVYNNTPCQPNSQGSGCVFGGGVTPSANWINLMTNRYNSTTGPGGCWGTSGSNNQSVCGRKAHFCPGNTPMKQAKCQWLTNFTSTNNCNC